MEGNIELCAGRPLGRQQVNWDLPGAPCSIKRHLFNPEFLQIWPYMAGWWRVLEEYRRLSAFGCENKAGWDSRQQQQNPSWAQKSTLPLPPLALSGPQPWGNLWAPQGFLWLPRAANDASSRSHGAGWGTGERKRGAGSFQESKGGRYLVAPKEVMRLCIRVSHIKVKRSGWCGQVKWICFARRKGEIG